MSSEQSTSTELVKKENTASTANTLNELSLAEAAKVLMSSGLVRNGEDLGKIYAKLSLGRDLGLPAVTSINSLHIGPNSSIILSAALMRMLINRSGKYKLRVKQRDLKGSSIEVLERMPDGEYESCGVPVFFGPEDAKRAGLDSRETYKKYPIDMYYARCLAAVFRTYTPDCASGCAIYLPEEIEGSGYKTDPVSGDAVPEAEYDVKPKVVEKKVAPPKRTATSDSISNIKKLMNETRSDESTFLNHYGCESLDLLDNDQQADLEQKLTQKKVAQKC